MRSVFGGLDFSMLLRLDPDRMAQLGITVGDVRDAVQEQNATNPAGTARPGAGADGHPAHPAGDHAGPAHDADAVRRHHRAGPAGRLAACGCATSARSTLGSQNYDLVGRLNGQPTAIILVYLRPGANALQVKEAFVARMNELAKAFPAGRHLDHPVRHHAVRHRLDRGGGEDAARGDGCW